MKSPEAINGVVLLCNDNGLVQRVIMDDIQFQSLKPEGRLFSNLTDAASRMQALNFLHDIKQNSIALDYQLGFDLEDPLKYLNFAGARIDGHLWVIGATNSSEAMQYLDYLQQINNEQANQIRQLIKSNQVSITAKHDSDSRTYEELSHLNNELVNLQRELTRKNAELERLNQLKNEFLGMAAHDLRSPLAIVMSYAEFLLQEKDDVLALEHREFLEIIYNSSEFMLRLIEDLLDVSQIESGNLKLQSEWVDLVELTSKNLYLNNILAARKGVTCVLYEDTKPVMVDCDVRKMEQVLNNLIGNAVKFSHAGSEVSVRITASSGMVCLTVSDKGTGISPEHLDKIFQPFVKGLKKGTSGESSTGLGLYIVKKIIEGHNGFIEAESEPGVGSTFRVFLPARKRTTAR